MYSEDKVEDLVGVRENSGAWCLMGDQVCDALWVRGGELEGDNAAATAAKEVEILSTKTESVSNGEDIAGLLSRVEVDK